MPEPGPRYWAFISYSHADARWARWLHRALEGYGIPRRLVGQPTPAGPAPRRLSPIFRDLDDMGAGPDLSDRLKSALAASANLIVVCSPAAARSAWVNEEIRRFKALHGEDRVLAVIVAGEPFGAEGVAGSGQECFPPALRCRLADGERVEPIAADLRPSKEGRHAALIKLVAGVLNVDLDEIVRRDAQRRQRQLLGLTTVLGAIAAIMGALALVAAGERDEARAQRTQAEGLVEFMIGDLREKLRPAGRLDILDAIGDRAQAYYAAQKQRGLDVDSLGRHARVLHLLGDIRKQRGDLTGALALFEAASKGTGELLARRPNDPSAIFDHAQSAAYVGEVAYQRGEVSVALAQLQTYQALARRLTTLDPANLDWQAQLVEADTDVGVVLLRQDHAQDAAQDFQEALAISRRLSAAAPANRERQWDQSQVLAWLADAEATQGHLDAALADRTAEDRIYDALIAASPHDTEAAVARANARAAVARIELAKGASASAILALETATADLSRLTTEAPDNADYKSNAALALQLLAQAKLVQGRLVEAAQAAQKAVDLCEEQLKAAEARRDEALMWRGPYLGSARVVALKIAAAREATAAGQRRKLEPAQKEAARLRSLLSSHPNDRALALAAGEAALLAGDYKSRSGEPGPAQSAWAWAQSILSRLASTASPTDRTLLLLRQTTYRLSLLNPPAGPLPPSPGAFRTVPTALHVPADYKW